MRVRQMTALAGDDNVGFAQGCLQLGDNDSAEVDHRPATGNHLVQSVSLCRQLGSKRSRAEAERFMLIC